MSGLVPMFSVVIPTHNRPRMLERALKSVFAQDFEDYEVVVVGDGSTESYSSVLRGLPAHARYVERVARGGAAAARNAGIAVAEGSWLVFLDDDDEWLPGFLGQQRRCIVDASPKVGFAWCSCFYQRYGNDGRIEACRMTREDRRGPRLAAAATCVGAGCGLTVRSSCLEEVGGFDESLPVAEDTELILRLLAAGYNGVHNAEVGVMIHEHRQSRLGSSMGHSERAAIHEALSDRYRAYLGSHAEVEVTFVSWAAVLHYRAGNLQRGDRLLRRVARRGTLSALRRALELRFDVGVHERRNARRNPRAL